MEIRTTSFSEARYPSRAVRLIRAFAVVALAVIVMGHPVQAQTESDLWAPPENLSRSGAASVPIVLPLGDGQVRVVWWDAFEGLTFVEGSAGEWSDPVMMPAPEIPTSRAISAMPRIVGDSSGTAHAFWIGEPDRESSATPLLFSQLPAGESTWTEPRVMVRSVASFAITTDSDDSLYLAYCRNLNTEASPSAIVFRVSTNGGETWAPQVSVHSSLYYRSASEEGLALRLAADADGLVILTWNNPQRRQSLLAASLDGGTTWSDPFSVGTAATPATNARPLIPEGAQMDEALLLWQGTDSFGTCSQFQAAIDAVVEEPGLVGRRVLDGFRDCTSREIEPLLSPEPGHIMILSGGGTDAPALSLWNGEDWSEPKYLALRLQDPDTGASLRLSALRGVILRTESEAPDADASGGLAMVGVDSEGDVWFTQSRISALSLTFAPPPPWTAPTPVASSPTSPDLPALVVDADGIIHALWSEQETAVAATRVLRHARWSGTAWTRATTVLRSSMGSAVEPSLVRVGDRLHAVWSDGPHGQIQYSRAFLRDAHIAGAWDEPQVLPGPTSRHGIGSRPQIVTSGTAGHLHVIYGVPVNEERGIYYTSSDDRGATWSEATQVFDAARAGWVAADSPRLAVDVWGMLHVVWTRAALSADMPSVGVYYAFSSDGGRSWSDPLLAAEGVWISPDVLTDGFGGVHLFWSGASDVRSWWHQWSAASSASPNLERDVRAAWSRAAVIPGFGGTDGPVALLADGALGLQVIGLGTDNTGEPALLQQTWSTSLQAAVGDNDTWVQANGRWGNLQIYPLDPVPLDGGVSAILQPDLERLDLLYRAETVVAASVSYPDLWHSSRTIMVTMLGPDAEKIAESRIVPAAPVSPVDTEAETPEPDTGPLLGPGALDSAPPEPQGGSELTLLISSGVATLLIVGVLGIRSLGKRRD
jgi:hypothetical protein